MKDNTVSWQNRLINIVTLSFLSMTMFFPVGYEAIKIVLVLAMMIGAYYQRRSSLAVPHNVMIYVFFNIFFILYALLKGIPITSNLMTLYIIYPVLFTIAFMSPNSSRSFLYITRTVVIMGLLVSLYDNIYALTSFAYIKLPEWFYIQALELKYTNYFGYTHFSTRHLGTLLFTMPFTLVLCMESDVDNRNRVLPKVLLIISFFSQALCAILSTRAALITILILSFPLIGLIRLQYGIKLHTRFRKSSCILFLIFVFAVIAVICYFQDYLSMVWDFLYDKLVNEMSNDSDAIRSVQAQLLIEGWFSAPLFGNGIGASLNDMIRDTEHIGSYELVYHAALFQTGLIGFGVMIWFYCSIIRTLIRKDNYGNNKSSCSIAYAAGLLCFLFANAVDPYLNKFGYMWVLYLPLSYGLMCNITTNFPYASDEKALQSKENV